MSEQNQFYVYQDDFGDFHVFPYGEDSEHMVHFWCNCKPVVDINSKTRGGEFIVRHRVIKEGNSEAL